MVEATAAAVATETGTCPNKPACGECGAELGWRDAAYVPADERGSTCKRCYQRAERRQLRGEFTPYSVPVLRKGKLVMVARPGNRALRRAAG